MITPKSLYTTPLLVTVMPLPMLASLASLVSDCLQGQPITIHNQMYLGGLTGVSETQLGISEIGAAFADASFGQESRIGIPFIFLLR